MDQKPRAAGIAALIAAATFVFGIVMFATVLTDYTTGDPTPEESVAFVVDHQAVLYVWNVVIFIVFGIVLVPLVLALRDRLKALSPAMAQASGAFGLIWAGLVIAAGMVSNIAIGTVSDLNDTDPAGAETVWSALDSVQNGLGGGNEIAGGVWIMLVSWAAHEDRGAATHTELCRPGRRCGGPHHRHSCTRSCRGRVRDRPHRLVRVGRRAPAQRQDARRPTDIGEARRASQHDLRADAMTPFGSEATLLSVAAPGGHRIEVALLSTCLHRPGQRNQHAYHHVDGAS